MARPKPLRVEIIAQPDEAARSLAARVRSLAAASSGTRSGEALVAGTVAIAVLPAVLPKLVELLNSWMALRKGRNVRVKVSRGDVSIEVEFAPGERGGEEILDFVDRLEARLTTKKGTRRKQNGPGI